MEDDQKYVINTNRGAALERLGRFDEAIAAYDAALAAKPDYAEAWHNRGVGAAFELGNAMLVIV